MREEACDLVTWSDFWRQRSDDRFIELRIAVSVRNAI